MPVGPAAQGKESAVVVIEDVAKASYIVGMTTVLTGGLNRPAMEKSAGSVWALEIVREIVREFGLEVGEVSSGCGSDGSFAATLGVPTLDVHGPAGRAAPSVDERMALVSGLIVMAPVRGSSQRTL